MTKVAVVLALFGLGCIDGGSDELVPGQQHQFVVSELQIPHSTAAATDLGFDLDGDGNPDNKLGSMLAQLFQADVANMSDVVDELVRDGQIVHLVEVRASSLELSTQASASMRVGLDLDENAGDNFSGFEDFEVDVSTDSPLVGHINHGVLSAGPGSIVLQLALPGGDSPFVVSVIGAEMEASVVPNTLGGRVGGAITKASVDTLIIPFAHAAMMRKITEECPGGECEDDSSAGHFFLQLFDRNEDGEVSLGEVRGHPLVESLTKPDVDLLDADGSYSPGTDGVADSLSVAVGIGCVGATF